MTNYWELIIRGKKRKEHGQDFACFGKHYTHPCNKNIIVSLFVPCAMMFVLTSSKPNYLAHFLISLRMIIGVSLGKTILSFVTWIVQTIFFLSRSQVKRHGNVSFRVNVFFKFFLNTIFTSRKYQFTCHFFQFNWKWT